MQKVIQDYSYKLTEVLGSGFSSTVFKGLHRPSDSLVAIKVVELSKLNDIQQLLLRNEIKAVNTVKSPYVLKNEAVLKTSNNFYIVSQYCEGGDLSQRIKKAPFPQSQALDFFAKIVDGYLAISKAGCVHRDLKPSNILLKNSEPRIGDFGFCDHANGQKANRFYNVGSPAYMSPQAYFDTQYSSKSDVWALGVILYEMLTQKPLLKGQYNKAINELQDQGLQKIYSQFDKATTGILQGCFQFNIQKRFTPQQLCDHLRIIRAQSTVPQIQFAKTLPFSSLTTRFPIKPLINLPQMPALREEAKQMGFPLKPVTIIPLKKQNVPSNGKLESQDIKPFKIMPLNSTSLLKQQFKNQMPHPLFHFPRDSKRLSPPRHRSLPKRSSQLKLIPITLISPNNLSPLKLPAEKEKKEVDVSGCKILLKCLKYLIKFKESGSVFQLLDQSLLLIIRVLNLQFNSIRTAPQQAPNSLEDQFKQTISTLALNPLTDSRQLNQFLYASQDYELSAPFARTQLLKSARELAEWTSSHAPFPAASRALKWMYEFIRERKRESMEQSQESLSTIRTNLISLAL